MGYAGEIIHWDTVRADCKYPLTDNNKGYIYGIYVYNEDDIEKEYDVELGDYIELILGDTIDIQWFKTEQQRDKYIQKNNIRILNE